MADHKIADVSVHGADPGVGHSAGSGIRGKGCLFFSTMAPTYQIDGCNSRAMDRSKNFLRNTARYSVRAAISLLLVIALHVNQALGQSTGQSQQEKSLPSIVQEESGVDNALRRELTPDGECLGDWEEAAEKEVERLGEGKLFFPDDSLECYWQLLSIDEFYGSYLRAMREPKFRKNRHRDPDNTTIKFRLFVKPSFQPATSTRIELQIENGRWIGGKVVTVIAGEINSKGRVVRANHRVRKISESDARYLASMIEAIDPREIPTSQQDNSDTIHFDGTRYIVEMIDDRGNYHMVERTTGDPWPKELSLLVKLIEHFAESH